MINFIYEWSSRTLFIFDVDEQEAWRTFQHELFEFRYREVSSVYRQVINGLLTVLEKVNYHSKKRSLQLIPEILHLIDEAKQK